MTPWVVKSCMAAPLQIQFFQPEPLLAREKQLTWTLHWFIHITSHMWASWVFCFWHPEHWLLSRTCHK